ncbi:SDR family NAD(P)-dependent oxidoreductase [Aquibium carbonis]|uniref:SDR family NAD(P)-dependent oxidoreductase n=1 Tax=Aquibium carbonis TaxID=2495581 RepID=A0A3R9YAU3_9HYPH|nr:SDR family NAD(P)-dependent oxidoreductase [Aquibium carbonis]RST87036.1 SDR family NAD(P)-dependent oxidoreductase [Aquibium carbonis]
MTKTILITGAARGIGYALADIAAREGMAVISLVRNRPPGALPGEVFDGVDVTDADALARVAATLAGRPIDFLVNNAGIIGPDRQSTFDMDFDGFRQTLEVNALAPLRVAQAFLPNLRVARDESGIARILTVTSAMGRMSYAKSDQIAYRASKAAVNKVMQGLATDLAPENIAVRLIHPGWVRTDMGGSGADISVEESAAGVFARALDFDMAQTCSFVDYRGETIPW